MKLLIVTLMLVVVADADIYTLQLYEKILGSLFEKRPIAVLAKGDVKSILQKSEMFLVVDSCRNGDVAVIGDAFDSEHECADMPIFATTHRSYVGNADAFGAFYWRKGRPQIHFKPERLQMFHLHLPQSLERFIDE